MRRSFFFRDELGIFHNFPKRQVYISTAEKGVNHWEFQLQRSCSA